MKIKVFVSTESAATVLKLIYRGADPVVHLVLLPKVFQDSNIRNKGNANER